MCTIFGKLEENGIMIGRSFDWVQLGGNICFIPSYRSYGVRTIGFCSVEQLGEDRPYEGMNEEGLFVGVTAIATRKGDDNCSCTLKIDSLGMVRYILERAKTVDDAMYIANKFVVDYRSRYGVPKVQYFFADTNNKIGIYEENNFQENVTLQQGEYRVLTNMSVTSTNECIRRNKIRDILENGSVVDDNSCMDIISEVKQKDLTAWSSVYNLNKKSFTLCIEQNYENKYEFSLEECLKKGRSSVDFAELKLNSRAMARKRHDGFYNLDMLGIE